MYWQDDIDVDRENAGAASEPRKKNRQGFQERSNTTKEDGSDEKTKSD